jgi:hypothetical protein
MNGTLVVFYRVAMRKGPTAFHFRYLMGAKGSKDRNAELQPVVAAFNEVPAK